jgi:hypothetical protein
LLAVVQTSDLATKSVLLEIAKQPEPDRQQNLWRQVQNGRLTVRLARTANRTDSPQQPKKASTEIELPEATVVVKFRSGQATAERVCQALELALSTHRSQI